MKQHPIKLEDIIKKLQAQVSDLQMSLTINEVIIENLEQQLEEYKEQQTQGEE